MTQNNQQFGLKPKLMGYKDGGIVVDEYPDVNHVDIRANKQVSRFDNFQKMGGATGMPKLAGDMIPISEAQNFAHGLVNQPNPKHPELTQGLQRMFPRPGYKDGTSGVIKGPGTGRSDSIPANLTEGDAIIPAARVKLLGEDFLNEIKALVPDNEVGEQGEVVPAQVSNGEFRFTAAEVKFLGRKFIDDLIYGMSNPQEEGQESPAMERGEMEQEPQERGQRFADGTDNVLSQSDQPYEQAPGQFGAPVNTLQINGGAGNGAGSGSIAFADGRTLSDESMQRLGNALNARPSLTPSPTAAPQQDAPNPNVNSTFVDNAQPELQQPQTSPYLYGAPQASPQASLAKPKRHLLTSTSNSFQPADLGNSYAKGGMVHRLGKPCFADGTDNAKQIQNLDYIQPDNKGSLLEQGLSAATNAIIGKQGINDVENAAVAAGEGAKTAANATLDAAKNVGNKAVNEVDQGVNRIKSDYNPEGYGVLPVISGIANRAADFAGQYPNYLIGKAKAAYSSLTAPSDNTVQSGDTTPPLSALTRPTIATTAAQPGEQAQSQPTQTQTYPQQSRADLRAQSVALTADRHAKSLAWDAANAPQQAMQQPQQPEYIEEQQRDPAIDNAIATLQQQESGHDLFGDKALRHNKEAASHLLGLVNDRTHQGNEFKLGQRKAYNDRNQNVLQAQNQDAANRLGYRHLDVESEGNQIRGQYEGQRNAMEQDYHNRQLENERSKPITVNTYSDMGVINGQKVLQRDQNGNLVDATANNSESADGQYMSALKQAYKIADPKEQAQKLAQLHAFHQKSQVQ
jgi:hypothetical protein